MSKVQAKPVKSGGDYLKEIKEKLREKPRDQRAWEAMSHADKSLLIRSAGLNAEVVHYGWGNIGPINKQKIRAAATRAANWINQLEVI